MKNILMNTEKGEHKTLVKLDHTYINKILGLKYYPNKEVK